MTAMVSTFTPSPETLVAAAQALQPKLRARVAKADRDAKVPDETVAEMKKAGLFRVLQPAAYGGYEMNPETFFDIQMTLARACMSTAWIYGVIGVHNWQLGLFDKRAQEDVWGTDTNVLISSSYMPKAKVTRVDGGYKISGRWGFSSGVDHCDWLFLGGMLPAVDGKPDYVTFLVPKSDAETHYVWDTIGLSGTGSHDVEVKDAFVPDYRIHHSRDGAASSSPGLQMNKSPVFRYPFGQIFTRAVSTSSIGALEGALDVFREGISKRVGSNDGARTALDPNAQLVAGEAEAAIDDLKLSLRNQFDTIGQYVLSGQEIPMEMRLRFRYKAAEASDRCAKLITRMFYSSGAQGIYNGNVIARTFKDIHTGRTHVANNADKFGRNLGATLFGEPNYDMFL